MAKQPDLFSKYAFVTELPKELRTQAVGGDPVQRRRDKMLQAIEQQRRFWVNPSLITEKGEGKKAARVWYKRTGTDVYMSVRYGARPIELMPGKPIVKLDMENVESFLNSLADAVFQGQLDELMARAAERTRATLQGEQPAKAA